MSSSQLAAERHIHLPVGSIQNVGVLDCVLIMLRRLKSFVKAHYGDAELTSFGFNLPLPPRHPRLPGEPTEPADLPAPDLPAPAAPPA